jgi:hypothetical protein
LRVRPSRHQPTGSRAQFQRSMAAIAAGSNKWQQQRQTAPQAASMHANSNVQPASPLCIPRPAAAPHPVASLFVIFAVCL